MDVWDANKLVLFIIFVVPGFIALKYYDLLTPRPPRESTQQLIDAIAYSCVNYAILFFPIVSIEQAELRKYQPSLYWLFYAFVLLVAPISWASLFRWLRTKQFFQGVMPHPTSGAWDYFFSQRRRCWVIVTLETGEKIGGRYDASSFASGAPATDLYLQEHWVVGATGGLKRIRRDTMGILILAKNIRAIEFFEIRPQEESDDARSERATTQGVAAAASNADPSANTGEAGRPG